MTLYAQAALASSLSKPSPPISSTGGGWLVHRHGLNPRVWRGCRGRCGRCAGLGGCSRNQRRCRATLLGIPRESPTPPHGRGILASSRCRQLLTFTRQGAQGREPEDVSRGACRFLPFLYPVCAVSCPWLFLGKSRAMLGTGKGREGEGGSWRDGGVKQLKTIFAEGIGAPERGAMAGCVDCWRWRRAS